MDDYREPTTDERTARRVLALGIALINTHHPLSTTAIRRDLYPEMADAAFKKSFSRDRARLAATGLVVRETGRGSASPGWEVDEESSFVQDNRLSPQDALALDLLLLPVAAEASFPYARDLRLALAKIDRSFDGSTRVALPPHARARNNNLTRTEDCMTRGHAMRIAYERADGSVLERTVAPYGLFALRGQTYLVAARAGDDAVDGEPPHTYNLARVRTLREVPRVTFAVPPDFDVRDFVKLPFAVGDIRYRATFAGPATGALRHEDVSSTSAAAAWALDQGLVPQAPQELVDEWHRRVERAAKGVGV